jgi:SAM-dependent methyltransferase
MTVCDLCGSRERRELVSLDEPRALRSDRRLVRARLSKVECIRCGLVREADVPAIDQLYYRQDYGIDAGDHVFHSARGPIRRSALMADWIERLLAVDNGMSRARVLEIGAGRGFLLGELARRWPDAACEGIELSADAAAQAGERGLRVTDGDITAIPSARFDLVVAVAVLEHVPAPTSFLNEIRRVLKPGGHAVLIQPTQDVPSYDVFFVDHLHHFGTAHVAAYSGKCGFTSRHAEVGFEFMPNFSAHLWTVRPEIEEWHWQGPAAPTSCPATIRTVLTDMTRLEADAGALVHAGRSFGVFGLHEVFALVRAYSALERLGISCGLDDDPGKPEYRQYHFPVLRPEECRARGVDDVFLTMNRVHYEYASQRLVTLGLRPHQVLS